MISFDHKVKVYYRDVDQMGIVYNTRYLEYFEESRTELLKSIGLSVTKIEEAGIRLPVVTSHCRYYKGANFEQELIVNSTIKTIPKAKLIIYYKINYADDLSLLVDGYTEHAFVNPENKPLKAPRLVLDKLGFKVT
tara:strand:+ start:215 stop:622 length:408 start_codon:yes stop_codon:yes gene_type:complete